MKLSVLAILALFVVYVGAAPLNRNEIKSRLSGILTDLKVTYHKVDLSVIKSKVRALKDKMSYLTGCFIGKSHVSTTLDLTTLDKATLRKYTNMMENIRNQRKTKRHRKTKM